MLRFDFVMPPFWQPFFWTCPKNGFLSLRLHNSFTIQVTAEIFPVLLLLTFFYVWKKIRGLRLPDAILLAIWPLKVSSKWRSGRPFSHSLLEQFPNLELDNSRSQLIFCPCGCIDVTLSPTQVALMGLNGHLGWFTAEISLGNDRLELSF